jgi:hypothetical protein
MARKSKSPKTEEKNLGRFAGSSDEEEEPKDHIERDVDDNDEDESEGEENVQSSDEEVPVEDDEYVTDDENVVADPEPAEKMANAMARILGTVTNSSATSSSVLAKTVTPLQRLQKKEKEEMKALREKRLAKRERNLTALHIPLSVATTNTIQDGRLSVTKELEQERFHRRVATRGVVALFNAISQHQQSTEVNLYVSLLFKSWIFRSKLLTLLYRRLIVRRQNEQRTPS